MKTTFNEIIKLQNLTLQKYFVTLEKQLEDASDLQYNTDLLTTLIANSSTSKRNEHQTIYFSGIGKNDTIAKKSANMLRSLQFDAHHLSPVDAMHGDMGLLREGDVIIALSKSGSTHELVLFLDYVKRTFKNIKIVGIQIGDHQSKFHGCCDFVIELPMINEIDSFNLVPTMSNIVTQLYIDMISITVKENSNMRHADFVKSHPGGAIGMSTQKQY